jgi:hypothetical protein
MPVTNITLTSATTNLQAVINTSSSTTPSKYVSNNFLTPAGVNSSIVASTSASTTPSQTHINDTTLTSMTAVSETSSTILLSSGLLKQTREHTANDSMLTATTRNSPPVANISASTASSKSPVSDNQLVSAEGTSATTVSNPSTITQPELFENSVIHSTLSTTAQNSTDVITTLLLTTLFDRSVNDSTLTSQSPSSLHTSSSENPLKVRTLTAVGLATNDSVSSLAVTGATTDVKLKPAEYNSTPFVFNSSLFPADVIGGSNSSVQILQYSGLLSVWMLCTAQLSLCIYSDF